MSQIWAFAIAFVLLATLACTRPQTPDPATRAKQLVGEFGADARSQWFKDSRNWDLGLSDEVAGTEATSPLRIVTVRDLRTPIDAQCGATDSEDLVYRTAILTKNSMEVICLWPDLDTARSGHRQVRGLVARSFGDRKALRRYLSESDLTERCRPEFSPERACTWPGLPL